MSNNQISAILVIVLIALALTGMVLGWRRGKRAVPLPPLPTAPTDLGDVIGAFDGLYLSTTLTDDRYRRVTTRGLGFRERGTVSVTTAGFQLPGDRFIPDEAVVSVGRASWTIDRGVEPDGLNVITWTHGETSLSSFFRLEDPDGFDAATIQYKTQNNTQNKTGQK